MVIDTDAAMLLQDGLDCDDDLHVLYTLSCSQYMNRSKFASLGPNGTSLGCGPGVELESLTNTYINSFTELTHKDTLELLSIVFGSNTSSPLKAYRGASPFQRNLHSTNAATDHLVSVVASSPPKTVTVVGIGSMTNLGAAVAQGGSNFTNRVERMVLLGGTLYDNPTADVTDINMAAHGQATNEVLSRVPNVTIVPVELMVQGAFTQGHFDWLKSSCPNSIAAVNGSAKIAHYLETRPTKLKKWFSNYPRFDPSGFVPWDVYAAMYVTHPSLFTVTSQPECCEMRTEQFHCYNATTCKTGQAPNVHRLLDLRNKTVFFDTLLGQLCGMTPGVLSSDIL